MFALLFSRLLTEEDANSRGNQIIDGVATAAVYELLSPLGMHVKQFQ